jgi:hypothetical protein
MALLVAVAAVAQTHFRPANLIRLLSHVLLFTNIAAITYFIIMFVLKKFRRVRLYANSPSFCVYIQWTVSVVRLCRECMAINIHAVQPW